MNHNAVFSAVRLIDAELSPDFLASLRADLVADLTNQRSDVSVTPQSEQSQSTQASEIVRLTPDPTHVGSSRRVLKIVLGAAACLALFATIAVVVVNRLGNDVASGDALHDVDPNEALPLGQAAPITPNVLSARWRQVDDFSTADYAQVSTATYSALPKCAKFTTFGMLPPTTKSVTIHHDFASDSSLLFHDVIVFATHEDATKAMDAISGGNFAECWFDVFDRLTPLGRYLGATSESVDLEAPQIQLHGERQFIIGQHIRYSFPNGPQERDFINAYVQVGRAITFVNPELSTGPNSLANVENVIAASADALEAEFGR